MADEKSRWERLKTYVKETPDRVEAAVIDSLKSAPGEAWQWLKDSINQARDELGKAFFHDYAAYMPWPGQNQDAPATTPYPQHPEEKVVPTTAPKHEPRVESPRQSAQIISLDALGEAAIAMSGVSPQSVQSINHAALGDMSPIEPPKPYVPKPIQQEQDPLTM